jgi:hypothetical protein
LSETAQNVTAFLNEYRECVRHLWNIHFRRDAERNNDWDLSDLFDEVAAKLFHALVLRKLGRDQVQVQPDFLCPKDPLMFLRFEFPRRSDLMVNRGVNTGYWDDPLRDASSDDLDLRFVQFFDWSSREYRDFALYRARIVASVPYPKVVGRDVLVPADTATKVLYLSEVA